MSTNHLTKPKLYIGIDLNDSYAMVSFLPERELEAVTVYVKKDQDTYKFPTSLYVGKNHHYRYGQEAEKKKFDTNGAFYDHLFLRAKDAIETEQGQETVSRLGTFLRRLLKLRENLYGAEEFEQFLVVTVPEMTPQATAVLDGVRQQLGDVVTKMEWMDYAECSYYYVYQQDPTVWNQQVAVFDFGANQLGCTVLGRDVRMVPQVVMSGQVSFDAPAQLDADLAQKDAFFADCIRKVFDKKIISGVFLLGEGFDGDWMKESLNLLTKNRRVFIGKNLYTKGAAMAAKVLFSGTSWNYRYECSYKAQANVSLQVQDGDMKKTLPLIQMGENWFEQRASYRLILVGTPEFQLFVEKKGERQKKQIDITLEDVWNRPDKTRKILIQAQMSKNNVLSLTVKDVGFGAFYAATGAEWSYEIELYKGQV